MVHRDQRRNDRRLRERALEPRQTLGIEFPARRSSAVASARTRMLVLYFACSNSGKPEAARASSRKLPSPVMHRRKAASTLATSDRSELMAGYERVTDAPMIVLSLAFVALLIYPIAVETPPALDANLRTANWLLWALFVIDYLVRFSLAPYKMRFVRGNLVDLAVVVLPLLAPLRILSGLRALRILRAVTVVSAIAKAHRRSRNVVNPQSIGTTLLILLVVLSVGAALEFEFERGVPGANIKSYGDSLWWAICTITTVGYGDRYPVTTEGRGVAALLMFIGVATVSLLAAGLTTVFVGREAEHDMKVIVDRLEAIEKAILIRRNEPPA